MDEAVRADGFPTGFGLGTGIIPASWAFDLMLGGVAGWIMFPVLTGLALTVGSGGFDGFSGRRTAGVVAGMLGFVVGLALLLMLPLLLPLLLLGMA